MKMNIHTFFGRGPVVFVAYTIAIIQLTLLSTFANASQRGADPAMQVSADLRLVVTASVDTVAAGNNVNYTVTVCNDGPDKALTPAVSRAFPDGTLISTTPSTQIDCNGTQTSPATTMLEPGFGITFTDTVRADVLGTLSYRAFTTGFNLPDPNPENNDVTLQTSVVAVSSAPVTVFQAAGPDALSIQSAVDQFRAALGNNNGNIPGPVADGRREINWDGGGSAATSIVPTPFDGFLIGRGARFTTNGSGFVQAPASGIADTFANLSYGNIFTAFSPVRLFSAIGSNITNVHFFVPGGGELSASTRGFGAIFTDVDRPNGKGRLGHIGHLFPSTRIDYFDAHGRLLHSGVVPAAPGNGGLSFFGIVLNDARIARVRITSGSHAPGPDETTKRDIVMMDDFIFGEPQPSVAY